MQTPLSQFQRQQLDIIARVTPHAMAGHILNTTVMAIAVAGAVPKIQLIVWCVYSYAIALVLLYRHVRSRGHVPRSFARAARRATVYAFFLALPWSAISILYLGSLAHDEDLILVALGVGMAASGTILLSAIPQAAFSYMSGILIPSMVNCLFFLNQKGYMLLGVLALSYWWFLAALIAKIKREISERMQADIALKESDARLQEALTAGEVMAFTWDPSA
jgi:PAS domain-containing protein